MSRKIARYKRDGFLSSNDSKGAQKGSMPAHQTYFSSCITRRMGDGHLLQCNGGVKPERTGFKNGLYHFLAARHQTG